MTVDELLGMIDDKGPPVPEQELDAFEKAIGGELPGEYRQFLLACNGGTPDGHVWFEGSSADSAGVTAGVCDIGGLREELGLSLVWNRKILGGRLPDGLIWIMSDHFGNAICLGVSSEHHGLVYFWDHEFEPDDEEWDGKVETAGNVVLLARSFTEFVAGLRQGEDS
jgi:hypothetical protein